MVAKGYFAVHTGSTSSRHAWSHFGKKWNIFRTYGWPKKSGPLKLRVIFCFCLLIVGRLVNVALPLYSKWIVNSLSDPKGFDYTLIYAMILLRLLHGGGNMNGLINTLRTYLWIPIRQYTYRELDVTLFNHLHSLPMQWHTSRQIGLVLKAANRGTNCVDDILNLFLFSMLPTLADFAIAVVFFASNFNIYFGVVVFVTMATHLALNIIITEWRTKFRRDMNDRENMMGAIGTDSLLNYETVKYYGNEDYEVKRYRARIESFQEAEWLNNATMAFQSFLLHGILATGMFSGSMLAVWMIGKGSLTVGDYVLFTSYIVQLYSPLNAFGHHYRMVQKSLIDMENMLTLFDEEPETDPTPDAASFAHKGGNISAEKLVFSYNDGQNILNDVSFKVDNGQTVALVGLSGSGKTSIIRLLYRLYDFCVGSLKIDGMDVRRVQAKSLRKQIGIVPQETALFNETIRFNIRYGDLEATDLEVEEAAKMAMIHDKIISLPLGYDTVVGDRGTKLSGGEKQRLAIARTILKKPNFIFLDEATSALDIHTERAIQGCLEKLCKDRTSLVVAHRLSTIVHADCILVMDKGKIVERGTHEELLAMEGVYNHMWQTQHTKHSTSTRSFPSEEDEE